MDRLKFAKIIGGVAALAWVVLGVYGASVGTATADPAPGGPSDPLLPTAYTNPETYFSNGDGTRVYCTSTLTYCWDGQ